MSVTPACCSKAPHDHEYEATGEFAYVTGDVNSDKAIIFIYDIFGFYPQTKAAADKIAQIAKARVYMPQFLEEHWSKAEFMKGMSGDKEIQKKIGDFFSGVGNPSVSVPKVMKFIETGIPKGKSVGIIGLCWGGKVATLSCGENKNFKAVASVHPAQVDSKDIEKVEVPFYFMPSKDENLQDCEKMEAAGKAKSSKNGKEFIYKRYENMPHGFLGARADLKDPANVEAFEEACKLLGEFFGKHL